MVDTMLIRYRLIVNTTFIDSYYEELHTDYLDKRNLPKLIIRLVLSILPH